MKKILIFILVSTMLFVGCNKEANKSENNGNNNNEQSFKTENTDSEDSNPVSGVILNEFETEDYDGGKVTQDIFKGKSLTVLNLWADWCGPCIEEMPEFEEVYKEYKKKNIQFIGLAIDSDEEQVKAIKEKLKITYPLIKENKELKSLVTSKFDYVPLTLFVNSEGEILKTFIAGSASKKELIKAIEKALNE